jgi:hypothetical protein
MKKNHVIMASLAAVITIASLALLSFRPATETQGTYATMSIYENYAVVNSKIVITYADDESEVIELGPFKYNDEYMLDNNRTINRAMNLMASRGYTLVTSGSSGKINSSKAMRISTYIFRKQ